jgi:zinc transporter, ZIP family
MSVAIQAGLWGLLAGGALVIGAAVAWYVTIGQRIIAAVMAFGSGVLISALSFELMQEAYKTGGFTATAVGFLGGAAVYTGANAYLAQRGARHRKRSGMTADAKQPGDSGSGLAIAVGALLDGIPESIAIGITMIRGGNVSLVAVVAIFLSNIPEGLSSAAGMKQAGRGGVLCFWRLGRYRGDLGHRVACRLHAVLWICGSGDRRDGSGRRRRDSCDDRGYDDTRSLRDRS